MSQNQRRTSLKKFKKPLLFRSIDMEKMKWRRNILAKFKQPMQGVLENVKKQIKNELNDPFYYGKSEPIKKKILETKDNEIINIKFNKYSYIIHPEFMKSRGSMCMSEMWSQKMKKEFIRINEEFVVDAHKIGLIKQDYESLYRPERVRDDHLVNQKLNEQKLGLEVVRLPEPQDEMKFKLPEDLIDRQPQRHKKPNRSDLNKSQSSKLIPFLIKPVYTHQVIKSKLENKAYKKGIDTFIDRCNTEILDDFKIESMIDRTLNYEEFGRKELIKKQLEKLFRDKITTIQKNRGRI